ncbi:MAG: TetR/AcrR family transcriptional regulator, partial [Opitutales bacterium]|nr:TetR/AcrR family transcriptional regulator [Opitutales bacterium]
MKDQPQASITPEERLLNAAEDTFLNAGVHRVTMDEIAASIGMSKRTVYQIIPGKEQLIRMVLNRFTGRIRNEVEAILDDPDTSFPEKRDRYIASIANNLSKVSTRLLSDLQRF